MGVVISLIGALGAFQVLQVLAFGPQVFSYPRLSWRFGKQTIAAGVWPDVVDNLASAVRAGMSLPQAVCELRNTGPQSVREVFGRVQKVYEATGDFHLAVRVVCEGTTSQIASKFVAALDIAYDVGGTDLGRVLRTLAHALREDINTRLEIRARQSWTINGARIAVGAPWVTALLLSSRAQAAQAYLSPQGIKLLIGCALLSAFAYAVMMYVSRLPQEVGATL